MTKSRNWYLSEFRDQIIAMARARRGAESLELEVGPCLATIHGWVKRTDANSGDRPEALNSAERDEPRRLRRENKQLRQERNIPSKGVRRANMAPIQVCWPVSPWFAQGELTSSRSLNS